MGGGFGSEPVVVGLSPAIYGRWPNVSGGHSNVGSAKTSDLRARIVLQSRALLAGPLEASIRTLGVSPDHCHLFGKEGRAFERRIVEVLSVA